MAKKVKADLRDSKNPMGPICVFLAGQKTTATGLTFKELEERYIENRREVLRLKGYENPSEQELWATQIKE